MNLFNLIDGQASIEVDKNGVPLSSNLQTIAALVLLYAAKADNNFNPQEFDILMRSLAKSFSLPDEESAHILEVANFLKKESGKLEKFTEILNQNLELSQRRTLLKLMWDTVSADGVVNTLETEAAKTITKLLGLTEADLSAVKA